MNLQKTAEQLYPEYYKPLLKELNILIDGMIIHFHKSEDLQQILGNLVYNNITIVNHTVL